MYNVRNVFLVACGILSSMLPHAYAASHLRTHQIYATLSSGMMGMTGQTFVKGVKPLQAPRILLSSQKNSHRSAVGILGFGYEYSLHKGFLGAETYAQISNTTSSLQGTLGRVQSELSQKFAFGGIIRGGLKLKYVTSYLKAGLEGTQFSHKFKELTRQGYVVADKTITKTTPALVLGAGVEKVLKTHSKGCQKELLKVRLDYTFRVARGFKTSFIDAQRDTVITATGRIKSHAVTLGLVIPL